MYLCLNENTVKVLKDRDLLILDKKNSPTCWSHSIMGQVVEGDLKMKNKIKKKHSFVNNSFSFRIFIVGLAISLYFQIKFPGP